MGEEGEDSNEGSGDGNEAYEGDDTEVCLALTHNVLNVKTLTLYSSLPTQLTSSMPHYPLPTLYVRDLHSIGIFYGNVAFPACALAFSTVSFNRHCLAVCRNFLSVWKLCIDFSCLPFYSSLGCTCSVAWVSVCKGAVNGLSLVICESCLKCGVRKPLSSVFKWITFEGSVWKPYQLQQWPEFIAKQLTVGVNSATSEWLSLNLETWGDCLCYEGLLGWVVSVKWHPHEWQDPGFPNKTLHCNKLINQSVVLMV